MIREAPKTFQLTICCFFFFIAAYELWFKQILWELDSVCEIFQNGHVSCYITILFPGYFLRM